MRGFKQGSARQKSKSHADLCPGVVSSVIKPQRLQNISGSLLVQSENLRVVIFCLDALCMRRLASGE